MTSIVKASTVGPATGIGGLNPADAAAVAAAISDSCALNTRKAYHSAWQSFTAWASGAGYPAHPATGPTLAAYLVFLADAGKTIATVKLHRAAVVKAHKLAGFPPPAGPEVDGTLEGLVRRFGRPQKQAAPLTAESLAAIRATAKQPRKGRGGILETPAAAALRGAVDIAIASVMRDGMLRVSEAAAMVWGDVEGQGDGTGRLLIARFKTDPEGAGARVFLGKRAMRSLDTIKPADARPNAPVFGLKANQLAARIKAMATAAGLGEGFSGHSARVGMAVDLAAFGTELPALMTAGRWKGADMPARYTEATSLGRGAVAKYYGGR